MGSAPILIPDICLQPKLHSPHGSCGSTAPVTPSVSLYCGTRLYARLSHGNYLTTGYVMQRVRATSSAGKPQPRCAIAGKHGAAGGQNGEKMPGGLVTTAVFL